MRTFRTVESKSKRAHSKQPIGRFQDGIDAQKSNTEMLTLELRAQSAVFEGRASMASIIVKKFTA